MAYYVRDRQPRNLTAWRLSNEKYSRLPQSANIGTDFAGRDVPKMKFLFTVSFEFGPTLSQYLNPGSEDMARIEYACKNVTRPNINVNYAEVNSYNYRYKVATRTDYGTVTLTLYDDNKNTAHGFISDYLSNISPIANVARGPSYYLRENIQEWASLGPLPIDEADGLIKSMRVTHHYPENNSQGVSGHKKIHYDYINPKIQTFNLDDLDMSASDVNTIGMTFVYDSVNIVYGNPGPGSNPQVIVNDGSEEVIDLVTGQDRFGG